MTTLHKCLNKKEEGPSAVKMDELSKQIQPFDTTVNRLNILHFSINDVNELWLQRSSAYEETIHVFL